MSATLIKNFDDTFRRHFQLLFKNPEHQQTAHNEFQEHVRENGVNQKLLEKMEQINIGE